MPFACTTGRRHRSSYPALYSAQEALCFLPHPQDHLQAVCILPGYAAFSFIASPIPHPFISSLVAQSLQLTLLEGLGTPTDVLLEGHRPALDALHTHKLWQAQAPR